MIKALIIAFLIPIQTQTPPGQTPPSTYRAYINYCVGDTCTVMQSDELYNSARECTAAVLDAADRALRLTSNRNVHIHTVCMRQSREDYDRSIGADGA